MSRLARSIFGLGFSQTLRQQHGYFHAGATISILDSAAGYAALTLVPGRVRRFDRRIEGQPARARSRALSCLRKGRVIKPGRTLTICRSDVYAGDGARSRSCGNSASDHGGAGGA
jgi:acyl-coenzyme A thioesterase PaaI-like protein